MQNSHAYETRGLFLTEPRTRCHYLLRAIPFWLETKTLSFNPWPSWTLGQNPHLLPYIVLYLISHAINLQLLRPEEGFWYN